MILRERKRAAHPAVAILLEWRGSKQPQVQRLRAKDGSLLRKLHGMGIACIVKGRTTDELKGELALNDAYSADKAVVLRIHFCRLDRHEIGDFTDALIGEEARDQDIGVWQIVLVLPHLGRIPGCNAEEATFASVQ